MTIGLARLTSPLEIPTVLDTGKTFAFVFKLPRFSCLPRNNYTNVHDNNIPRYFSYFLLGSQEKRKWRRNALATGRGSTYSRKYRVSVEFWRMSAIQAVSTRWFSAIYSRRSAPRRISSPSLSVLRTRRIIALRMDMHTGRLPRARTLAPRLLTSQRGSILKHIGNVFTSLWTRSK